MDKLGKANVATREDIVASLRSGTTHITSYRNDNNPSTWRKGENVSIMPNSDFIRTDNNETKADNLGNLPEF